MELAEAEQYALNPQTIIDPGTCNLAQSIINGWITDREEEEFEKRLAVDREEDKLFALYEVNAIAQRKVRLSEEYKAWQEAKRQLAKYKRLRRTLSERFQVLTNIKHY
jgi:hypothetical protein